MSTLGPHSRAIARTTTGSHKPSAETRASRPSDGPSRGPPKQRTLTPLERKILLHNAAVAAYRLGPDLGQLKVDKQTNAGETTNGRLVGSNGSKTVMHHGKVTVSVKWKKGVPIQRMYGSDITTLMRDVGRAVLAVLVVLLFAVMSAGAGDGLVWNF